MIKILIPLAFLSFAFESLYAQDPYFLNYTQSQVALNPSFAGSSGGLRNQSNYRNQSLDGFNKFTTAQTTIDAYLRKTGGGIALSLMMDNQNYGILKTNYASLAYAHSIRLKNPDYKLIPSIQLTYMLLRLDVNALTLGDAINSRYNHYWNLNGAVLMSVPVDRKSNLDAGAGLLFTAKKFNIGITGFHLNQPDIGMAAVRRLPLNVALHSSYMISLSEKSKLRLFFRYSNQNNFNLAQVAADFLLGKNLVIGSGYHNIDGVYISPGYQFRSGSLQLLYAVQVSGRPSIRNTVELSATFLLGKKAGINP